MVAWGARFGGGSAPDPRGALIIGPLSQMGPAQQFGAATGAQQSAATGAHSSWWCRQPNGCQQQPEARTVAATNATLLERNRSMGDSLFLAMSEWIGELCGKAKLRPHVNHAPGKERVQLS
jgi:hypothetical protein